VLQPIVLDFGLKFIRTIKQPVATIDIAELRRLFATGGRLRSPMSMPAAYRTDSFNLHVHQARTASDWKARRTQCGPQG